jgi:hypothetical protein
MAPSAEELQQITRLIQRRSPYDNQLTESAEPLNLLMRRVGSANVIVRALAPGLCLDLV